MDFPKLDAMDIVRDWVRWYPVGRSEAIRACTSRPVAVIHQIAGQDVAGWLHPSSRFFGSDGPFLYGHLRYFLYTGAEMAKLKGMKVQPPSEETEWELAETEDGEPISLGSPTTKVPTKPNPFKSPELALELGGKIGALPGLPGIPKVPGIPEIPALPEIPKAPGLDIPKIPELPTLPELPAIPEIPTIPEIPKLPDLLALDAEFRLNAGFAPPAIEIASAVVAPKAPLPKTEINLELVDQDGAGLEGIAFRVVDAEDVDHEGKLDAKGKAKVEKVAMGEMKISFPDLDASEWIPGIAPQEAGEIHIMKDGEHLANLADENGFHSVAPIADHPKNSELKAKRGNLNLLAPGDELFIPSRNVKSVSKSAPGSHAFKIKRDKLQLRLTLQHGDQRPITGKPIKVDVEGSVSEFTPTAEGKVEVPIAMGDRDGTLSLEGLEVPLAIGRLDPVETDTGMEGRLINLGYLSGPPGEADARERKLAIEEFQFEAGLKPTGAPDDAMRDALVAAHGV